MDKMLFDLPTWEDEWHGMPEYNTVDRARKITVNLPNESAVQAFAELTGQKITPRTLSMFFPPQEWHGASFGPMRYVDGGEPIATRYPIYIPSKGRWDRCCTVKALAGMRVPYWVVVEPSEREHYAAAIDPARILVLPDDFSKQGNGSIPARNWIWEHAGANGHERHWQIDDNIRGFMRLVGNARIYVESSAPFRCIEDFSDRYSNVALSGIN